MATTRTFPENELFSQWQGTSDPALKDALQVDLINALRGHARAVAYGLWGIAPEEVIERIIWEALRNIHKFEGRSKFSTWFHVFAKRQCVRAGMNRRRDEKRELVLTDEHTSHSEARQLEARMLVEKILGSLEGDSRAILQLRLEGLNWEETAERLGLTSEVARQRWSRLKQEILNTFGEEEVCRVRKMFG